MLIGTLRGLDLTDGRSELRYQTEPCEQTVSSARSTIGESVAVPSRSIGLSLADMLISSPGTTPCISTTQDSVAYVR
jgi:hypothetical protein